MPLNILTLIEYFKLFCVYAVDLLFCFIWAPNFADSKLADTDFADHEILVLEICIPTIGSLGLRKFQNFKSAAVNVIERRCIVKQLGYSCFFPLASAKEYSAAGSEPASTVVRTDVLAITPCCLLHSLRN
ncbi:unnamed protein product [Meloidogyne enterolobii]|uniref:Uncharacterized protein n=1 Tax=Meloidogyne enterolobii TaxID=390850 RepID=A0ACB1B2Q5_MELEN